MIREIFRYLIVIFIITSFCFIINAKNKTKYSTKKSSKKSVELKKDQLEKEVAEDDSENSESDKDKKTVQAPADSKSKVSEDKLTDKKENTQSILEEAKADVKSDKTKPTKDKVKEPKVQAKLTKNEQLAKCLQDSEEYLINGKYEKALTLLLKAKKSFPNNLSIINRLGKVYHRLGDIKKANQLFAQYLDYSKQINSKVDIGIAYNNLGNLFFSQGKGKKALDFYEKALKIFSDLKINKELAVVYSNFGDYYLQTNQLEDAKSYYEKSLEIDQELNINYHLGIDYHNLGLIYKKMKSFDSSIYYYEQALAIFKQLNATYEIALALNNLGELHKALKRPSKAREYFLESKAIFQTVKAGRELAVLYNNIGGLNYAENKLDLAIYNYEKAVKIAQQFKDKNNLVAYQNNLKIVSAKCFCDKERITSPDSASRDKAIALNNKGLELKNKGKPDKAIENYLKAFKIFKDKKLENDLSITYFNLGCAYQEKEEYDVAITYFSKAIEKTNADKLLSMIKDNSKLYNKDKEGTFPMHIARTYSNKGYCYRMKGDYNSAILNYEMAITIDEAMGCYREVMNDNNNLGIAHYFAGRFGQAAILLKKAADIAKEFDDTNNLVNYYCALGRTYISLNYNNTGYYYYDEAKKLLGKKNKKYSVWISKTINKLKSNGAIIDPTMVKGATDKSVSLYTYQIEDFRQISEEYKRVILERDRELIVTVDKDILDDDVSSLDTPTKKIASKFDKKNVESLEFDETKAFGNNTKLATKNTTTKTKVNKDLSADPTKDDTEKTSSGKTLEDITGDNIPEHAPKSMLSYGEASEGSEIGAFRGGESKPSEDEQNSVGHEE